MILLSSWCVVVSGGVFAQSTLDPFLIPKFENELFIPAPHMPQSLFSSSSSSSSDNCDYYEIALRQFDIQMLPPSMNLTTTVWGFGSLSDPNSFTAPSLPIEAQVGRCVRVKWLNQLVDVKGRFLSHLIPAIDQNLHWANPLGPVDSMPMSPVLASYEGPVPMVPHLHGAHTSEESDGHPMAWFLPDANNLGSHTPFGSKYAEYKAQSGYEWEVGTAVYEYPNTQPATMLWFHDHALGITRLSVYAGAAGVYILRDKLSNNSNSNNLSFVLPTPDIPLVIQDRSFLSSGGLHYPLWRDQEEDFRWAEGFPRYGEPACGGYPNDVKPMVVDEYFANTIVVNGRVWPRMAVAPARYRFRVLNACNARFLQLSLHRINSSSSSSSFSDEPEVFYIIGGDGGFLPKTVNTTSVLLSPAERLDLIIDFSEFSQGEQVLLRSDGPEWVPTDPLSTGLIMRFDITLPPPTNADPSTPPLDLVFPSPLSPLAPSALTDLPVRRVAIMMDSMSKSVKIAINNSIASLDCYNETAPFFGPTSMLLGSEGPGGEFIGQTFQDAVTEQVEVNVLEIWEIHNLSPDTHPMHVHQTHFRVLDRLHLLNRSLSHLPESWESGLKDTVIVNPGEITRLLLSWERPGLSLWHCHILEHEDNEMMRPLLVIPSSFAGADNSIPKFPFTIVFSVGGGLILIACVILVCCFFQKRKRVDPLNFSNLHSQSIQQEFPNTLHEGQEL